MSVHLTLEGQPSPFLSLRLAMMLVFHCKVRWRERKGGIQTRMIMMMWLWWTRSQHSRHCFPASLPLQSKLSLSLSQSLSRLGFLFLTAANAIGRNQFVSFNLYSAPIFFLSHELDFKKNALNLIEGSRAMICKSS